MFGLFGSDKPYNDAMEQYQNNMNQAQGVQQPWLQAGQGAIGDYQKWLRGQQNPSGFINNLMKDYQQSPYNQYLQQESQNAGINAASASGLTGSTPFMQQQQQNAGNIAQGGMNDWLKNVLGINTQYGEGQQNLMKGGQTSANALSGLFQNNGLNAAGSTFGAGQARDQDMSNLFGWIAKMFFK